MPVARHGASVPTTHTEAATPLSVSVRDGHVSVSAGFARLADSSTARILGRLCWLPPAPSTTTDVKVSEPAAAVDVPPGGCRCSARAGPPPIIACAFGALVPLMRPTWGPQRAQAPSRRWQPPVIARERLALGMRVA